LETSCLPILENLIDIGFSTGDLIPYHPEKKSCIIYSIKRPGDEQGFLLNTLIPGYDVAAYLNPILPNRSSNRGSPCSG